MEEPTPFRFTLLDGEEESIVVMSSDDFDGWAPMEGELVFLENMWWCVDEIRHIPKTNMTPYTMQFTCLRYEDDDEPLHLDSIEGYL